MEKKGSRLAPPASKGLTSDSKKSQDVSGGKLWPRSGRRREPAGGSSSAKSESSRKPAPQRAQKTFEIKRPRPRGTPNANAMGRTETTRLEERYEAELGSVFVPGSKKQSLNHLLNFVYQTPAGEGRYQSSNNKSSNRLIITKKHKYNKEHFLQANCQFVVNSTGDYKQYLNNPDALVDWNLIEQVYVQVSECPSCPICLYPPVAAKMTRCGHIYCWSCVLHYLSLSDKTWRKCPICYESVHKQDLKSVVSKQYRTFNVDDVITFRLMKRPKGSLVIYPATAEVGDDEIIKFSEIDSVDAYSKLVMANQGEILSIIDREQDELSAQLLDNGECPENCFIEEALSLLNDRRHKVFEHLSQFNVDASVIADDSTGEQSCIDSSETSDETQSESLNMPKFHYFYQASDGQHIYLHAMNARMLEHTFGSLEQGPRMLTGKILEKEGGSMTEELRNRLRYLHHLPVTCQFEVAEIQLKSPVVSKETLEHFSEQIKTRRRRRQHRAQDEERRAKKIAAQENRMMGKYPVPNLHIESQSQFPCFEGRARSESECTQPSEASSPSSSLSREQEHAGPSFAKMLASSRKPEIEKWPALKAMEAPVKLINVTGQKMAMSSCVVGGRKNDSEPELEDLEPIPPSRSLGDAIVQALQKEESEVMADSDVPLSGKKKKRKNRQKVLFTTTIAYTGK